MSETTVILRSLLLQAKKAKTTKEIVGAISSLCSNEDVAVVEKEFAEYQKDLADEQE